MKNGNITKFFVVLISASLTLSCANSVSGPGNSDNLFDAPPKLNDGWATASPADAGMKSAPLASMLDYIEKNANRVHSILIVKDSKLVFEKYFAGNYFDTNDLQSEGSPVQYTYGTKHFLASVSKSVTSVLFGIAADKGLIGNLDRKISEFYPKYENILTAGKQQMTVRHFLTMTAGLAWDESSYYYNDRRNNVTGMFYADNLVEFVLGLPLTTNPGTAFHYNSGYANVLSDIIKLKSGIDTEDFAIKYLFEPLGIDDFRWDKIRTGYLFASGGLYLSPRNLAKIGWVYLNNGEWNGRAIVSSSWIKESTKSYINPQWSGFGDGYGYQWWRYTFSVGEKNYSCFFAAGWGEQEMFLFPGEKLLVLINCGYFLTQTTVRPHYLVANFILNAL